MGNEIDFRPIMKGLRNARESVKVGDFTRVYGIMEQLKVLPIPPAYIDGMREELISFLRGSRMDGCATSVYLAFYGERDSASFLKIGIAKNVRNRLSGIATGNPLPNLWTYTARFTLRDTALLIESVLLKHMEADKAHGEWVNVQGLSEQAALAVVESLAEVATAIHGEPVRFVRGF